MQSNLGVFQEIDTGNKLIVYEHGFRWVHLGYAKYEGRLNLEFMSFVHDRTMFRRVNDFNDYVKLL